MERLHLHFMNGSGQTWVAMIRQVSMKAVSRDEFNRWCDIGRLEEETANTDRHDHVDGSVVAGLNNDMVLNDGMITKPYIAQIAPSI